MAKRQLLKPWWLGDGTEICSVCHHLYLYETEYRCFDCDGGICLDCVELTRTVCLPCANNNEDSIEIELEV
jgi:hypothetical protein